MDANHFETILHALATSPSRRRLLRLLAGSALGGLLSIDAGPTRAKPKGKVTLCHQGQTMRVSKKAKKKHLWHGDTLGACSAPPPSPPVPVLTYQCPGPSDTSFITGSPATTRFAQTFIAAQSGTLQQIQLDVEKDVGSTGNYLVELLAASSGVPTNVLLAAANILNASVPDGVSTLTATFSGPPLTAGTEYAAALSRPGGSSVSLLGRTGDTCTGRAFAQNPNGSGPFNEVFPGVDIIASVTVLS